MDFIATPTLELVTLLASLNDAKLKDCFIFAYSGRLAGCFRRHGLDLAGGGVSLRSWAAVFSDCPPELSRSALYRKQCSSAHTRLKKYGYLMCYSTGLYLEGRTQLLKFSF